MTSCALPQEAEIVRTRDPEQLAACDVVVDVGGEYDPRRHRYDHHQRWVPEDPCPLCVAGGAGRRRRWTWPFPSPPPLQGN